MASPSPTIGASTGPSSHRHGLRFLKLDLHSHTPASACFNDKTVTADQIVTTAIDKKLSGLAITDHNSGEWIDQIKTAAAGRDLVIFPGAEITCMGGEGGIHIIALFDQACGTKDIESLLGELGLKPSEYGKRDTLVQKDPITVAQIIRRRGGLAILAHANSSKGALHDMKGEQRTALVQATSISGAEGTDFQDAAAAAKHRRVVDLLDGTDPTYQKKLAVYQASDNPSGNGDGQHGLQGIATRCAYFKLDRVNLEGLRQCLADPDVRIRQDYELLTRVYPRIVRVKVNSGFLNGSVAVFHEGLNSILGAKGSGKSLLIEFLRFALNHQPINSEILEDHTSKLATRLGNYGKIEITLSDESGKEFTIGRTYNPAEDSPYSDGISYDPAQIFPVLFLSQNEIIKIAESESEQIGFIDRFFDFRAHQQAVRDTEKELELLDSQLADGLRAHADLRTAQQAAGTVAKEVEQLDAALKNPIFDQYTEFEIKAKALREHATWISSTKSQIEISRKTVGTLSETSLPEAYREDPSLQRSLDITKKARAAILSKFEEAQGLIAMFEEQLSNEHTSWTPQFLAAKKKYDEAVQKEGGDYRNLAQRRAKKIKDLETLTLRVTSIKQRSDRVKDISAARSLALEKLTKIYEEYTKERQAKCAKIENESNSRLTVRIHESSNKSEFQSRLMALKRGSHLKEAEIEKICAQVDPGSFVRAVIRFALSHDAKHLAPLADTTGIDVDRMRTLVDFLANELPFEQILALEYKARPQDRPEIKYNVGQNTFQPLKFLSVGQKCTAMLIIALSEGVSPIVIDQPEDSLDIRSIWEDMCQKLRRGKDARQFVFTTHNSSLAVASDTDKFLILEAGASHGEIVFSGSMDHAPVSGEVMKYLEGGLPAYLKKFEKYRAEEN